MQIPSYQISNVIKVYSKQLSQSRVVERQDSHSNPQASPVDRINISVEGKRQTIVDKVSGEVLSRITRQGPQNSTKHEIAGKLKKEFKKNQTDAGESENKFVFNFIGENNQKHTNSISIEGTKLISKRLEQLAQERVDNNIKS